MKIFRNQKYRGAWCYYGATPAAAGADPPAARTAEEGGVVTRGALAGLVSYARGVEKGRTRW